MNDKYQKQRLKLAIIYFAILFFIVSLFSFIIIQTQNQQFRRFERFGGPIPVPQNWQDPNRNEIRWSEINDVINEIKAENLKNVLLLDAVLLALSSILAYYLSGKTLEPILETLNKQKRFVSDASHELKTPLTNIKTEAEVLNRSKKSTIEEYKEFTSNTIEDINRLDELVTYLLDAARFEDKKITVSKTDVDLPQLIENIIKKFQQRARTKNIEIQIKNNLKNNLFQTDSILFERLISIILDNSIKYNKEKGEVVLNLYEHKGKKVISIKDTGKGIHPDDLPKIFDRFYRASEDRNEKGFGLGLSIAKQLAFELNLDIDVDSTLGEGTEFILIAK